MSQQSQHTNINETILMAYITNELSSAQRKTVDDWLNASRENKKQFENIKKTWKLSGQLEPKPVSVNTEKAWQKVSLNINTSGSTSSSVNNYRYLKTTIGIAASLLLFFTVYNFWLKPVETIKLVASKSVLNKTLDDGSAIVLNKNAQIKYPEKFDNNERRVELDGEAFFEIARDTSHPFIIDLPKNAYVKVLGTSFTIDTEAEGEAISVFVKSGKVEFGNAEEKLILVANEKAVYKSESGAFEKIDQTLGQAESLYWINEKLVFEGEQLSDIVAVLSSIFMTDIELLCSEAAHYPIISDHQHEKLEDILEVICLVHNLTLNKKTKAGKVSYTIICND